MSVSLVAVDERQVLDIVVRIVMAALGEVGRPANGDEVRKGDLRRAVVEGSFAGIGKAADAE